jgi:hypothetical protein
LYFLFGKAFRWQPSEIDQLPVWICEGLQERLYDALPDESKREIERENAKRIVWERIWAEQANAKRNGTH